MTLKEFRQMNDMERAQARLDWAIAACCIIPSLVMIIGLLVTSY